MLVVVSCGNVARAAGTAEVGSAGEGPPRAASSLLKGRQPQAILGTGVKRPQARGGRAMDRVGGRFPPVSKCSCG